MEHRPGLHHRPPGGDRRQTPGGGEVPQPGLSPDRRAPGQGEPGRHTEEVPGGREAPGQRAGRQEERLHPGDREQVWSRQRRVRQFQLQHYDDYADIDDDDDDDEDENEDEDEDEDNDEDNDEVDENDDKDDNDVDDDVDDADDADYEDEDDLNDDAGTVSGEAEYGYVGWRRVLTKLPSLQAGVTILYWPQNIYPIFPSKYPLKFVIWDPNKPVFPW